jgi:hypothetical protein
MPWVLFGFIIVYGILCIVFAFLEPPSALRSLFKVPSIFVFLPDRLVMPVGRVFVGLCALFVAGFLFMKFSAM